MYVGKKHCLVCNTAYILKCCVCVCVWISECGLQCKSMCSTIIEKHCITSLNLTLMHSTRGKSRCYLWRKLGSFKDSTMTLHIFSKSEVESGACFTAICWGKKTTSQTDREGWLGYWGLLRSPWRWLCKEECFRKLLNIMNNSAHSQHSDQTTKCVQSDNSSTLQQTTRRSQKLFIHFFSSKFD